MSAGRPSRRPVDGRSRTALRTAFDLFLIMQVHDRPAQPDGRSVDSQSATVPAGEEVGTGR